MVTVAKSFDAPVKLLFPKDVFNPNSSFSMLGLGDIVIPGIFISLLLKFDGFRALKGNKKSRGKQSTNSGAKSDSNQEKLQQLLESGSFSKPYFYTNFIFYIVGLITTIVVMHIFQAPQPALLYLVPACLGASFLTALLRGEVSELFSYSEEPLETPKPKPKPKPTQKAEAQNVPQQNAGKNQKQQKKKTEDATSKKKDKKKESTPPQPRNVNSKGRKEEKQQKQNIPNKQHPKKGGKF